MVIIAKKIEKGDTVFDTKNTVYEKNMNETKEMSLEPKK
jgi:hypothetical protein